MVRKLIYFVKDAFEFEYQNIPFVVAPVLFVLVAVFEPDGFLFIGLGVLTFLSRVAVELFLAVTNPGGSSRFLSTAKDAILALVFSSFAWGGIASVYTLFFGYAEDPSLLLIITLMFNLSVTIAHLNGIFQDNSSYRGDSRRVCSTCGEEIGDQDALCGPCQERSDWLTESIRKSYEKSKKR